MPVFTSTPRVLSGPRSTQEPAGSVSRWVQRTLGRHGQAVAGWAVVVGCWVTAPSIAQAQVQAQAGSQRTATSPQLSAPTGLDAELFYQLLLAEMQWRSREAGAAYSLMLDAAKKTGRPELYRRAIEFALQGRAGNAALSAAQDWTTSQPQSEEPLRYQLQILLALNRAAETGPVLRELIRLSPAERRHEVIGALPQALARVQDGPVAIGAARDALQPWLNTKDQGAAAWSALGRVQLTQQKSADALTSAQKALQIDPRSAAAADLATDLIGTEPSKAEPLVLAYLQTTLQDAKAERDGVHLSYVRALLDQRRHTDAAQQLQTLLNRSPDLAEAWLIQGQLQARQQQDDAAERSLRRFLELSNTLPAEPRRRGSLQAYLQLAELAERRRDFAGAKAWLDRIDDSQEVLSVQLRRAQLLARQGDIDGARDLIRKTPTRNDEDVRRKWMSEAQMLRDAGRHSEAYETLKAARERLPDDPDLLYDHAMAAERLDRFDEMERLLRRLMELRPDHHHAYNALGYALADRNQRLPEAKALIQKALQTAPDDPYIMDSLGWVEYRMGNLAEALRLLQIAYDRRADPEIASHLGEVLWVSGQRERALAVWREALKQDPGHEALLKTLQRFQVKP